jgi:hypothetical protein
MKIGLIYYALALSLAPFCFQAQADQGFDHLIALLQDSSQVANCSLKTSVVSKNSYEVTVTQTDSQITQTLAITSPDGSLGRIKVEYFSEIPSYLYSESDVVGWTHLSVGLNAQGTPSTLKMYKTLPKGTIYNVGIECGEVR